jgi:uncharacterized cupredoxin-like copper-binding protein
MSSVQLFALSTGHKLGLAFAGGTFIVFALVSALVLPRWWPQFPGKGRGVFIALTALLFVGMLASVEIFGREQEEASARGEKKTETSTSTQTATTGKTTTAAAPTTTQTETTMERSHQAPKAQAVKVSETEFKITLAQPKLSAGKVEFDLSNVGKIGHDLTVKGPGVDNQKTPVIQGGQSAKLSVTLQPGQYELYCSVAGHKAAGMDLKVTVS